MYHLYFKVVTNINPREELLSAIEIIVDKMLKENITQIYNGVCRDVEQDTATMTFNGETYNKVKFYGSTPKINGNYRIFVPNGNISNAFFITGGEKSEDPSVVSYNSLTDLPKINGVVLSGNKTSQDLNIVSDKNYVFTQEISTKVWNIKHNLNKYPCVTVVDSGGSVVIGEIEYNDINNITITFTSSFSGKAYCN